MRQIDPFRPYKDDYFEKSAWDTVQIARNFHRIKTGDVIQRLFTHCIFFRGDRKFGDDSSVIGGIARYGGVPITFLGINKGHDTDSNVKYNFGMPNPEGYRKAKRLIEQADKFSRPIITIVDTPGAFPGREAEERGQGMAIAECIQALLKVRVPTFCIILSEAGSGGALAFSSTNRIYMLENAIFSVISPEGCAQILWRDGDRADEAAECLKITAHDLYYYEIIDGIIPEEFNNETCYSAIVQSIDHRLHRDFQDLKRFTRDELVQQRYEKFRAIGSLL